MSVKSLEGFVACEGQLPGQQTPTLNPISVLGLTL